MRAFVLLCVLTLSMSSFAADRNAKIKKLMETQGLVQMFEQQLELEKKATREQAQVMIDQLLSSLKAPAEIEGKLRGAYRDFAASLTLRMSGAEVVEVWAGIYGKAFTDAELDQLIAFYTSPLGQKDIAVTQKSLPEFSEILAKRTRPVIESAVKKYAENLQRIAKECNCTK